MTYLELLDYVESHGSPDLVQAVRSHRDDAQSKVYALMEHAAKNWDSEQMGRIARAIIGSTDIQPRRFDFGGN